MKLYVITAPSEIRGIYPTWVECKEAVAGVRGARYQSVDSREKAEAMLAGGGITLPTGKFAFTDGNAAGGVGLVLVEERDDGPSVSEISTSVVQIFEEGIVSGLDSEAQVLAALGRLHNILAEMAGLYLALLRTPPSSSITVVHDYEGVSAWVEGRWKANDPVIAEIVGECKRLIRNKRLVVTFRHQRGHQSTWVGRDDYASWNARADSLATEGSIGTPRLPTGSARRSRP